jgi:sterol 14-demethylase
MRMVMRDLEFKDYRIAKGKLVCIAPPVTHRMPELFPDPEAFDPDRYAPDRAEDENLNAWQPFGGGRHRCSGNAFAIFQIKTILAVLLRRHVFELVDPLDSYCDDYTQMIVQPASPCRIRYRERTDLVGTGANSNVSPILPPSPGNETKPLRIHIDMNLCQGHAVCMGEAPELFHVGQANDARVEVLNPHPNDELVAKARRAAKFCPTKAIALRTL